MPRFDTAIFDLDGTLTDSAPGIINSIRYAVNKLGYREMTDAELRSCVSASGGAYNEAAEYFRSVQPGVFKGIS